MKQNIDIWSLGCVFSEAVRWLPHTYRGIVAYSAERKAEIDNIPSFNGVDCFHNGQKALTAVRESNEKAKESLLRKDFITDKVMEMIGDMLVPAEDRPDTRFLWSKQIRILESAKDQLASLTSPTEEPNALLPRWPALSPHHTLLAQTPITIARMPPVMPPDVRPEATTRTTIRQPHRATLISSHTQSYNGSSTVLDHELGLLRLSPESLTEIGDENVASSPVSRISVSQADSQHTSSASSPSQLPPISDRPNYPYRNQQNHEDETEDQLYHTSQGVVCQGSQSRPRGTSRLSASSNPRNSAPVATTPQSKSTSPSDKQQRQSLHLRQVQNANLANIPFSPGRQQEQQHQISQPGIRQLPPTPNLSIQEALQWRAKRKGYATQTLNPDKDLLNRLKDRDHVSAFDFSYSLAAKREH